MKKVQLLVKVSGTRNGLEWPPFKSVISLPDSEADDLVKSGSAVFTDEAEDKEFKAFHKGATPSNPETPDVPAKPETATGNTAPENAAARASGPLTK